MRSHVVVEKAVLIARDADERELLIELLADIGLETVVETAIPSVVTDPAVVLTDLGARYDPRKGRAAVRRLRERWPQAPVILLTSHRAATDESDQEPGPDQVAETRDLVGRARAAMAGLSDGQRAALELAYFGGKTSVEVAELEGIPLGTAKTRIRSALLKLRQSMEAEHEL